MKTLDLLIDTLIHLNLQTRIRIALILTFFCLFAPMALLWLFGIKNLFLWLAAASFFLLGVADTGKKVQILDPLI